METVYERRKLLKVEIEQLGAEVERVDLLLMENKKRASEEEKNLEACVEARRKGEIDKRIAEEFISDIKKKLDRL